MSSRILFFVLFMVFMVVMLALDLGVFHKKDHVIKMKEAAIWTGIWVSLAMLFGVLLLFKAEWIHGITSMEDLLAYAKSTGIEHVIQPSMEYGAALDIYRKEVFQQYLAGYFLEESLSIDNIFVMIMIFVSFGIDKRYYHRILFWGILGAIVLRFLFIFLLGTLVEKVSWILAVFGVVLIFSGIKMFRDKGDEKIDTANHPAVRFASRFFPLTEEHEYENKVRNSHSIFKFEDISAKRARELGLFDYPPVKHNYQECILGRQFPEEVHRQYELFNAWFGFRHQLHVFILCFDASKGMGIAEKQRAYWEGGNRNEFIVCLGLDGDTVRWCHAFSWMDEPVLSVKAEAYFREHDQLDLSAFCTWLQENVSLWKRKNFHDFDYLTVSLTTTQNYLLLAFTLAVNVGIAALILHNFGVF